MHLPSGIQCKASLLSLSVSEASAPCWSWKYWKSITGKPTWVTNCFYSEWTCKFGVRSAQKATKWSGIHFYSPCMGHCRNKHLVQEHSQNSTTQSRIKCTLTMIPPHLSLSLSLSPKRVLKVLSESHFCVLILLLQRIPSKDTVVQNFLSLYIILILSWLSLISTTHLNIQRTPTKHFAPSKQRLLAAICREVPLSNSLQRTSTSVHKQIKSY